MNAPVIARYNKFFAEAEAALSAGFFSMSAKKDANRAASRAYEALRDCIWDAVRPDVPQDEFAVVWDSLPYELRHVKPEKFLSVAGRVGLDVADMLKALMEIREAIAAEEVQKKVKVVKTVADPSKGERVQYRGVCQVCGREHAIVSGLVAKHGYTVELGFFNGVCRGEHFAPMQHSVDESKRVIEMCEVEAVKSIEAAKKMEAGEISPAAVSRGYGKNKSVVKFEEADVYEQIRAREAAVWGLRGQASQYRAHSEMLGRLVVEYFGKELRPVVVS